MKKNAYFLPFSVWIILFFVGFLHAENLYVNPLFTVIDSNGDPLNGGLVYSYECGTSTPKALCADNACAGNLANPFSLDANGQEEVYGAGCYKINVKTSAGVQVTGFPVDEYYGFSVTPARVSLDDKYDCDLGAAITAIGATATTLVVDCTSTLSDGDTDTIPSTMTLEYVRGGLIQGTAGGGTETLTINGGLIADPSQQIFGSDLTVTFGYGLDFHAKWAGTITGATINFAQAALASGGKIIVPQGTYTIASGTIIISNDDITLELKEGAILNNTTGTDFTIKITGDDCAITGPGTIQVPASPAIAGAGLVELRKAAVWNTGDRTRIEDVVFQNSISYTVFNEGGDNLRFINNQFYGGYSAWDIGDGNNHFAYYQDGGSDNTFQGNYFESYVSAIGSGTVGQAAGKRLIVTGNTFEGMGQHPVYTENGADSSVISNNTAINCGSLFALTGSYYVVDGNTLHYDPTIFNGDQSGIGMRNSIGCIVSNNIITGSASQIVLGFENTGVGVVIRDNIIIGNTLDLPTGDGFGAIRIGTNGTTTTNQNNKILNNIITIDQTSGPSTGNIYILGNSGSNAQSCEISGNTVNIKTTSRGIMLKYAEDCSISNNTIINDSVTASTYQVITLDRALRTDVTNNQFYSSVAGATASVFTEVGTAITEVGYNRYYDNKFNSASTDVPLVLISGSKSEVRNLWDADRLDNINAGVGEVLLSTTTVPFNANGDTVLYTVPAAIRCVLTKAVVVAGADAGATTTMSIGANGAETDFVGVQTLSNLDAANDAVIIMPVPNATPVKIKSYNAAVVIDARVANQSGGATNAVHLYGMCYY